MMLSTNFAKRSMAAESLRHQQLNDMNQSQMINSDFEPMRPTIQESAKPPNAGG